MTTPREKLESAVRKAVRGFRRELDVETLPYRIPEYQDMFNDPDAAQKLNEGGEQAAGNKERKLEEAVQAFLDADEESDLSQEEVMAYAQRYAEMYERLYMFMTRAIRHRKNYGDPEEYNLHDARYNASNGWDIYVNDIKCFYQAIDEVVAFDGDGGVRRYADIGKTYSDDRQFLVVLRDALGELKALCEVSDNNQQAVQQKRQEIINLLRVEGNQAFLAFEQQHVTNEISATKRKIKARGIATKDKKKLQKYLEELQQREVDVKFLQGLDKRIERNRSKSGILKALFPKKSPSKSASMVAERERVAISKDDSYSMYVKIYETDALLKKLEREGMSEQYRFEQEVENFDKQPVYLAHAEAKRLFGASLDRRGIRPLTPAHIKSALFPMGKEDAEVLNSLRKIYSSTTAIVLEKTFDTEATGRELGDIRMLEDALADIGCAFRSNGMKITLSDYADQPDNPVAEMVNAVRENLAGQAELTAEHYIQALTDLLTTLNEVLAYQTGETLESPLGEGCPLVFDIEVLEVDIEAVKGLVDLKLEVLLESSVSKMSSLNTEIVKTNLTACANSLKRHLEISFLSQGYIEINPDLLETFSNFDAEGINADVFFDRLDAFEAALQAQNQHEQERIAKLVNEVFDTRGIDQEHTASITMLMQMAMHFGPELADPARLFMALQQLRNQTINVNDFYVAFKQSIPASGIEYLAERVIYRRGSDTVQHHVSTLAKMTQYALKHDFPAMTVAEMVKKLSVCDGVDAAGLDVFVAEAENYFLETILHNNSEFVNHLAENAKQEMHCHRFAKDKKKQEALDALIDEVAGKIKVIALASTFRQPAPDEAAHYERMNNACGVFNLLNALEEIGSVISSQEMEAKVLEINEMLSTQFTDNVEHGQIVPPRGTGLTMNNTQYRE